MCRPRALRAGGAARLRDDLFRHQVLDEAQDVNHVVQAAACLRRRRSGGESLAQLARRRQVAVLQAQHGVRVVAEDTCQATDELALRHDRWLAHDVGDLRPLASTRSTAQGSHIDDELLEGRVQNLEALWWQWRRTARSVERDAIDARRRRRWEAAEHEAARSARQQLAARKARARGRREAGGGQPKREQHRQRACGMSEGGQRTTGIRQDTGSSIFNINMTNSPAKFLTGCTNYAPYE